MNKSLLEKLKPTAETHAIVELALVLFLKNPIDNPKRFHKLQEEKLLADFSEPRTIFTQSIGFKVEQESVQTNEPIRQDTGFELRKFDDGKISWVIRGVNENKRNILGIHCLSYSGWRNFKEKTKDYLDTISEFDHSLEVIGMSLNYVDSLDWNNEVLPDMSTIFNSDSKLIPEECIESDQPWSFTLSTLKKTGHVLEDTGNWRQFLDTEIIEIPTKGFSISITQQSVFIMKDSKRLSNLLASQEWNVILDEAHEFNSQFMKKILSESVQKIIGLI